VDGSAFVAKLDLVGQLFHQKYTTAAFNKDPIIAGGIRKVNRVKTASFVGDFKLDQSGKCLARQMNLLALIQLIAVYHGVIDGFGQTDQNIGIERFINPEVVE